MRNFMKMVFLVGFVALFSSCLPGSDTKQILSKQETRKAIMDSIANDSSMSHEMMTAMMNSNNGKMMMQGNEKMNMMMMENHTSMMRMMKNNPVMMQSMMTDMMETCKGDSSMMSGMCKTMMGDPKMMDMMNKIKGMDKMEGMDKMKGMGDKKADHSAHH